MRVRASFRFARAAALLLGGLSSLASVACKTTPKPDPDGQAGQAVLLALDETRADQLHCDDGDCADWYRFEIPEAGELQIDLSANASEGRPLRLLLAGGRAEPLEDVSASAGAASLRRRMPRRCRGSMKRWTRRRSNAVAMRVATSITKWERALAVPCNRVPITRESRRLSAPSPLVCRKSLLHRGIFR